MNWRDVWILYAREMRGALRERTVVVNSVLMPIFLYPVMLWAMFSALTFVQGRTEGFTTRVAVLGVPGAHAEILDTLEARDDVDLRTGVSDPGTAYEHLRLGDLDAVVRIGPARGGADALAGNVRVEIHYDRSEERSNQARVRIEGVVDRYRSRWMEREATALEIPEEEREVFRVVRENVSTEREMGSLFLGQIVPLFLVVMVAVGCFIPAVDTTAGERERSTWETTMTVAASRLSVVTAKYLHVATLGIIAALLNVVAVFVSIGAVLRPLLRQAGGAVSFTIPWLAVPVMSVGAVALALFFAAAMMILAAFARTFKEGQAMITPVYYLALLPLLLGTQTDRTLTPVFAAIPVANVAMMIRDALTGVFLWPLIIETLGVTLLLVAACLLLARAILRFEDFLLGSYDGSFWRFVKERFLEGRGRRGGGEDPAAVEAVGD